MTLILLTGAAAALLLLAVIRQHSWVLLVMAALLQTSVLLSVSTTFWSVDTSFGLLILLSATAMLSERLRRMAHLWQLSALFALHLIAPALSTTICLVILSLMVLIMLASRLIQQQSWGLQLAILLLCLLATSGLSTSLLVWGFSGCVIWLTVILSANTHQTIHHQQSDAQPVDAEAIRSSERSRIYQNIHDDVGADLLKLIYQAESETQREAIQSIMQRLRQAVAKTEHRQLELVDLLHEICLETASSCQAAGIAFQQDVEVDRFTVKLDLPAHLQRMIRELTANTIKHAAAGQLHLHARTRQDQLILRLSDDGRGLQTGKNQPQGKGLTSLQRRASQHGASITWQGADNGGTTVVLEVPLA